MSDMFGAQKTSVFGSFGEFTIGDGSSSIQARYLLTKIKPGSDGTPACELASQMKPWREVFNVEELSFDELLQRDLDDSRVAHELIPYLLGAFRKQSKVFSPQFLRLLFLRKTDGAGIQPFYPIPSIQAELDEEYGDLFDFKQITWDGKTYTFCRTEI